MIRRVNDSSANMSQNLAESLLDFIDDDSSNIHETTTVKQAENKYTCIENSDDFEAANTEHSLAQCNGQRLCQYLQLDGSRLLWKGKLELLKDITSELLQKHGK